MTEAEKAHQQAREAVVRAKNDLLAAQQLVRVQRVHLQKMMDAQRLAWVAVQDEKSGYIDLTPVRTRP
jgi:hypothetical protein